MNTFATPPTSGSLEQDPSATPGPTAPAAAPGTAAAPHGTSEGAHRPLAEIMAPDWAEALAPVEPQLRAVGDFLRAEAAAGRPYLPAPSDILRAFQRPLADVRVLIVGQDPYPTPGHAMGLSFSVQPHVRPVPRSLQNIYAEMATDLGTPTPVHGDLSAWSEQGVMLLNRVLTVGAGDTGSHRRKGWEAITEAAIRALVARDQPLVAILWGRDAATLKPLLGDTPVVESAHPSPLSARRGFFGSRPFSRVNELLVAQGSAPVDWALPAT
ncbi:uracil-DNA glycosylase [Oerskovia sp. NPDC056781]|uniref:uracil-DNA glycosylase n=1 Tax=Oerskovia sp. NPDC056781 TaxID=3345942 RepID=UPI00366BBE47